MNLSELREDAARLCGFTTPWVDRVFPTIIDGYLNRANLDVSIELKAPTRYAYLDNQASDLPLPSDAWESGLISVKVGYDTNPRVLPIKTVSEAESSSAPWTSYAQGEPEFCIHDPMNVSAVIQIVPKPSSPKNYAIEYVVRPNEMVNDGDRPLNGQSDAHHRLVSLRAAILYCEYAAYQENLDKTTQDRYVGRLRMLRGDYDKYLADVNSLSSGGITVKNPFWRI